MMNINESEKIKVMQAARDVFDEGSKALTALSANLGDEFLEVVGCILAAKGRLIITGIGKSALISQKITATINSTGSSSIFMHAADAMHGDLGMIMPGDLILCISRSGESPEIRNLVRVLNRFDNELIAMCSDRNSFLAKASDYLLYTPIEREADPNNLAPTTSTTAQLAMGDALAIGLQVAQGFEEMDFARIHPGGTLGKKLNLLVSDLIEGSEAPQVSAEDTMDLVILEISSKRKGAVAVIEEDAVVGIITDGDLRRKLHLLQDLKAVRAKEIMSSSPKKIAGKTAAVQALQFMKDNRISQLIAMEGDRYLGMIHLHQLLEEGLN